MTRAFSRYSLLWGPFVASALVAIPMRADTFTYTGAAQTFTATTAGVYDIVAYGAQGGARVDNSGGLGAEMGGDITLTAGEVLTIDVGGGGGHSGGGGGGTFVVTSDGTPLVVAGGGGGGGGAGGTSGTNGQTGTSGASGNGGGGAGGTNGSGGGGGGSGSGFDLGGGGGAGFSGAGGNGGVNGGSGGSGYSEGLAGGSGNDAGNGGYGGGGGGGEISGGGGGGYSGGGGGGGEIGGGGGGGSFLAAVCSAGVTSDCLIVDAKEIELSGVASPDLSDNGYVTITEIPAATPEPASLTLLALGFLGIPLALKLRSTT